MGVNIRIKAVTVQAPNLLRATGRSSRFTEGFSLRSLHDHKP
jgi:hypothetical protein